MPHCIHNRHTVNRNCTTRRNWEGIRIEKKMGNEIQIDLLLYSSCKLRQIPRRGHPKQQYLARGDKV